MTVPVEPAHRTLRAERFDTAAGPVEAAVVGDGHPVVLLHGFPGNWRQAVPLALDLAGTGRVRAILPSRPGYGRTPESVGRTPAEQAGAWMALLDHFEHERAAFVGISGGGPSAAAAAAGHPDRVTSLVLCCPLAPHLMTPPPALARLLRLPVLPGVAARVERARRRRRVTGALPSDFLRADLTPAERDLYDAGEIDPHDLLTFHWSHLDGPPSVPGMRTDLRGYAFAPAPPPDLGGVTAPTLVLHGDEDAVVPLDHGAFYADAVPGGNLEVQPGAGHAFILTFRARSSARIAAAVTPT